MRLNQQILCNQSHDTVGSKNPSSVEQQITSLSQEHDANLTCTKVFRNALVDSLAVLGLKGPLRGGTLRDP